MTTTVADLDAPPLTLANSNLPERPADPLPLEDPGFLALVREAHPNLTYVPQRHRGRGETVHVFRDRVSREFVVWFQRDDGRHTVKESGFPWWDRLHQLVGQRKVTQPLRRGGAR